MENLELAIQRLLDGNCINISDRTIHKILLCCRANIKKYLYNGEYDKLTDDYKIVDEKTESQYDSIQVLTAIQWHNAFLIVNSTKIKCLFCEYDRQCTTCGYKHGYRCRYDGTSNIIWQSQIIDCKHDNPNAEPCTYTLNIYKSWIRRVFIWIDEQLETMAKFSATMISLICIIDDSGDYYYINIAGLTLAFICAVSFTWYDYELEYWFSETFLYDLENYKKHTKFYGKMFKILNGDFININDYFSQQPKAHVTFKDGDKEFIETQNYADPGEKSTNDIEERLNDARQSILKYCFIIYLLFPATALMYVLVYVAQSYFKKFKHTNYFDTSLFITLVSLFVAGILSLWWQCEIVHEQENQRELIIFVVFKVLATFWMFGRIIELFEPCHIFSFGKLKKETLENIKKYIKNEHKMPEIH